MLYLKRTFILGFFTVLLSSAFFSPYLADENISMSNYRLGSGDTIQIIVFDEDDLSQTILLGDTGVIKYPYLGEIKVTGLTTQEVEGLITKGLKPQVLINPSVQVSVTIYRPFFISGEINNPGDYPYQPGLTVSRALAIAGGTTERASKSGITVVRATDIKQQSIKVKLTDVVYPGDILNIDVTCILDNYFGDTSRMVMIGAVDEEKKNVVETSYKCLHAAVRGS